MRLVVTEFSLALLQCLTKLCVHARCLARPASKLITRICGHLCFPYTCMSTLTMKKLHTADWECYFSLTFVCVKVRPAILACCTRLCYVAIFPNRGRKGRKIQISRNNIIDARAACCNSSPSDFPGDDSNYRSGL